MLRSHLESVERSTRRRVERLHRKCPAPVAYLWGWFLQLHQRRLRTEAGPMALTYGDVESWSRLMLVRPAPREVAMLMELDNTYLDARSKHG